MQNVIWRRFICTFPSPRICKTIYTINLQIQNISYNINHRQTNNSWINDDLYANSCENTVQQHKYPWVKTFHCSHSFLRGMPVYASWRSQHDNSQPGRTQYHTALCQLCANISWLGNSVTTYQLDAAPSLRNVTKNLTNTCKFLFFNLHNRGTCNKIINNICQF